MPMSQSWCAVRRQTPLNYNPVHTVPTVWHYLALHRRWQQWLVLVHPGVAPSLVASRAAGIMLLVVEWLCCLPPPLSAGDCAQG
jgi:hypothetical protein